MTHAEPAAASTGPAVHRRSMLGRLGVGLGFVSVALVVFGAVGAKAGLFGPSVGFGLSTAGAALAAVAGLAVGLVALVRALRARPRLGLRGPAIAVALCGLLLAIYAAWSADASRHPPIHDIATDWRDPIMPSPALLADRGDGANPIEAAPTAPVGAPGVAGQTVAQVNARTCPGAAPVIRAEPVDKSFTRAREAAKAIGLRLVSEDVGQGRIEGVATGGWYGFKDDVMIRLRSQPAGSRIDLRSVSRMGVSDRGANCARVTKLRQALAG